MTTLFTNPSYTILGILLILSSIGVISLRKPVHASLSFLLTLIILAALFLELSAQFIAVMQILVYAGAILVIFMFVIILFQDAYLEIGKIESKSSSNLLYTAAAGLLITLFLLGKNLIGLKHAPEEVSENYGTVQALGKALYLDYFFPFEAVILLFLVALIGTLYIAKKEK